MGRGHRYRFFQTVFGIALLAVSTLLQSRASAQCTDQWLFGPDQGHPGIIGDVNAALEWTLNTPGGPRQVLVAAGSFKSAGRSFANSIAYWDGEWHPLGTGVEPVQNPLQWISALCVYRGELIAAGWFKQIGGVSANNIARWTGSTWVPLGLGTDGKITTLCAIGDILYAGGRFAAAGEVAATNIAAWNGSEWAALDKGLPTTGSESVFSLVEFQGQLCAGGIFTISGSTSSGLATWNGSTWQGNSGLSFILSLCAHKGALYATTGGGAVRKLNGTTWTEVGAPGKRVGSATTLIEYNGRLAAAIKTPNLASYPQGGIATWDGVKWESVGTGIHYQFTESDFEIRTLATFGANLVAAGEFISDAPLSRSIAQWNGADWKALGEGVCLRGPPWWSSFHGSTPSVAAFGKWNGDLVMGGVFADIGPASNIAIRHAGEWTPLGNGLTHTESNGHPFVVAITQFGNQLIAAGVFNRSGQTNVNNIAAWNGFQWSALGLGLNGFVRALVAFNGDLVAAGQFTTAGETEALRIARWDGAAWHAIGSGANNIVYALAVYQGELIAGGAFTSIGGVDAAHIARWNGARWAPLGVGIDDSQGLVYSLAVHKGDLIAGGGIHSAGGTAARGVARWNGYAWSPLGLDLYYGAYCVVDHHGSLFALRSFSDGVSDGPQGLAKWTGSSWQIQGTGFDGFSRTLLSWDNELLVGGDFSRVDGQISIAWARYGGCSFCPADLNGDSGINEDDFSIFTTAYDILDCSSPEMPVDCNSDFTHDGFVDDADFQTFISAYDAMTCP